MRTEDWIRAATQQLRAANIETARLDALVLLEDETGKERGWLLAHPEYILQTNQIDNLLPKLSHRAKHMPLAYIRGKAEFYGRKFRVNSHTLVPRPETEALIEMIKELKPLSGTRVLDIGTGSGCIAITVSQEIAGIHIDACDIDRDCLKIAAQNARELGVHITFFASNLLEQAGEYDILLANLPYVPEGFELNEAAKYEPPLALFGGVDGLALYRKLFLQIKRRNTKPRSILTESLPFQHKTLSDIAAVAGFRLERTDDFIQLFSLV